MKIKCSAYPHHPGHFDFTYMFCYPSLLFKQSQTNPQNIRVGAINLIDYRLILITS